MTLFIRDAGFSETQPLSLGERLRNDISPAALMDFAYRAAKISLLPPSENDRASR